MEKEEKLKLVSQKLDSAGIASDVKPLYMHNYEIIIDSDCTECDTQEEIDAMIEEDLKTFRIVREGEKDFNALLAYYEEHGEFPLQEDAPKSLYHIDSIDATDDENYPTMFLVKLYEKRGNV